KLVEGLFAAYIVSAAVAFLRPVDPAVGWSTWVHQAFLMLVYVPAITTLLVLRPDLRRYALPVIVISVTLPAALREWSVAHGLVWQTGTRIAGAFGSVQLWPYAVAVVGVVAVLMSRPLLLEKVIAAAALVVLIVAELFLRARMLWLASMFGACIFGV